MVFHPAATGAEGSKSLVLRSRDGAAKADSFPTTILKQAQRFNRTNYRQG
jgi:hypothetical protein